MPLINRCWKTSCLRATTRFAHASLNLEATQWHLLHSLLGKNADSLYGRKYQFNKIRSWGEYRDSVPIVEYSDLSSWIEKIAEGQDGVLTSEKVLLLEPTSGSSSAAKLIPYTNSLRWQFQEAIKVWIRDLFLGEPTLLNGRSYWSISPPTQQNQYTSGGVKIGFQSDTEYLGRWERRAIDRLMAVPASVLESDDFMNRTAQHLRKAADLRFISVWNPSFLEVLLEYLDDDPATMWPHLRLLSCWGDASARKPMASLAEKFPGVRIQPKGLLSTEGVVSIPLLGQQGGVLCGHCHAFEFENHAGELSLAHQLEVENTYEVIITTGGGLYRYRTDDLVKVVGHKNQLPILEFIGRKGGVVDIHGEKLHPDFVESVFHEIRAKFDLREDHFLFLAPHQTFGNYTLYIDRFENRSALTAALDQLLSDNPHYAYCRKIGQLGPVEAVEIEKGKTLLLQKGPQFLGIRAGDMKPMSIHSSNRWDEVFLS